MNVNEFKTALALYCIRYVDSYRNSYGLVKVLSWRFGILDVSDLLSELVNKKYVSKITRDGVNEYTITSEGVSFLSSNLNKLATEVRRRADTSEEFIEALLAKSSSESE